MLIGRIFIQVGLGYPESGSDTSQTYLESGINLSKKSKEFMVKNFREVGLKFTLS